jgi:hypothetical protein
MVGNEELECMAGHSRKIKLSLPPRFRGSGLDPLDVRPIPGPVEANAVGVKADETAAVAVLTGIGQHRAGATTDVQNRARHHDQLAIEAIIRRQPRIPRVQYVIQRRGVSVRKHRDSIHSPSACHQPAKPSAATARTMPDAALEWSPPVLVTFASSATDPTVCLQRRPRCPGGLCASL